MSELAKDTDIPDKPITFGRYEILRRLAKGGMAEVFLGRVKAVEGFQREVVIKRVLPEFSVSPEFTSNFLAEAKLTAQLVHPHIAQVFELDRVGESYFIAMEYVRGFDLGIILAREKNIGGKLPLSISLRVMIDLCEGLEYAHEAHDMDGQPLGIVHRDVTPSNLLVSLDGIGKIVDFGIAKATQNTSNDRRTATGTVKGKVSYMAPEQILGESLDRRVDVFAAGISFYEMLTGKNPFRAETDFGTLKNIIETTPLPPSAHGSPTALDPILAKALSKVREKRYQTIAELLADIEKCVTTLGVSVSHTEVGKYLRTHKVELDGIMRTTGGSGGSIEDSFMAARPIDDDKTRAHDLSRHTSGGQNKKSNVGMGIALGFMSLLAVAGGGFFVFSTNRPLLDPAAPQNLPTITVGKAPDETPQQVAQPPVQPSTTAVDTPKSDVGKPKEDDEPPSKGHRHKRNRSDKTNARNEAKDRERDNRPALDPPASGTGRVRIISKPIGAEVFVDGKRIGETPFPAFDLGSGTHKVVISHEEFQKREQRTFSVTPDKETTVEVDFTR